MRIRLRYFAVLRERAGRDHEELELDGTPSAGEVFRGRFPDLSLVVAYARNGEMCGADAALSDGDELALLPPLGGG